MVLSIEDESNFAINSAKEMMISMVSKQLK